MKTPHLLIAICLSLPAIPSSAHSAAATIDLVEALTASWLREKQELDGYCKIGIKINKEALSFWNPYLGTTRVKAFTSNPEALKQCVDSPEQLNDKDTTSAFADAQEAGLLRAMRKQCPDVW
jgi:hypothetical protein